MMDLRKRVELMRWLYFVLLFFLSTTCIVVLSELAIGPGFQWLLYDTPYQLPTWNRAGRMGLAILFTGFFAGTVCWYYEKRSSGR